MRRETTLALCILGLVAVMFVVAAVAPGATGESKSKAETREQSSLLRFTEATVTPERIGGETVTLTIDTHLRHRGGTSEDVGVVLRAANANTGLVANRTELSVDDVKEERDLVVSGNITLERDSDYDIEALVYENGTRVATGRTTLKGLDTLEPDYAKSPLGFRRFPAADLPAVEYSVGSAGDEATLDVSAYVTNRGDGTAGNVELELIARQTDSRIVADRERVDVDQVAPGRTTTPSTTLTVPDGYNYYLDAMLWRDGVIVDTVREAATLAPNGSAPETNDSADAEDSVELGDFETEQEQPEGAPDGERGRPGDAGDAPDGDGSGGQPGFGPLAALAALAVATLGATRIASTNTTDDSN